MTLAEPETWIKLNRNILKWQWYNNANTMRVFIHLLLKANVKEGKVEDTSIRRGQMVTSFGKIAKELCLTVSEVRTALSHLESTGEVRIHSNNHFSIVTVNNYEKYQSFFDAEAEEKKPKARKTATKKKSGKQEEEKSDDYIPQFWETDLPKAAWRRFASLEEYEQYVNEHREEALQWPTN